MGFIDYVALILSCGAFEAGFIDTKDIVVYEEVRKICEENVCRNYGKSWACPPAVGTLDECRIRLENYKKLLLFSGKYEIEDSFDYNGMHDAMLEFKNLTDRIQSSVSHALSDCLILSNEGCGKCKVCTYPNAPCKFSEKLYHSIEGYGVIVSELAKLAGIHYINGINTVTYFGGILMS